jgi:hypothetical protein
LLTNNRCYKDDGFVSLPDWLGYGPTIDAQATQRTKGKRRVAKDAHAAAAEAAAAVAAAAAAAAPAAAVKASLASRKKKTEPTRKRKKATAAAAHVSTKAAASTAPRKKNQRREKQAGGGGAEANDGSRLTSHYIGVLRASARSNKWRATACRVYLGVFDDEEEAARAYDRKVLEMRGANAVTNFPATEYDGCGEPGELGGALSKAAEALLSF